MANKEQAQEQPKTNGGYEFLKGVAWVGLALFAGSVILHSLAVGNFHQPRR